MEKPQKSVETSLLGDAWSIIYSLTQIATAKSLADTFDNNRVGDLNPADIEDQVENVVLEIHNLEDMPSARRLQILKTAVNTRDYLSKA